jgi:hypothetical protein
MGCAQQRAQRHQLEGRPGIRAARSVRQAGVCAGGSAGCARFWTLVFVQVFCILQGVRQAGVGGGGLEGAVYGPVGELENWWC